jgi:hypothetical protein
MTIQAYLFEMLTVHDISTGLQSWVSHAEAMMALQQQEIQRLKDENEALRLSIPPHPIPPIPPTPVRVLELDLDEERE